MTAESATRKDIELTILGREYYEQPSSYPLPASFSRITTAIPSIPSNPNPNGAKSNTPNIHSVATTTTNGSITTYFTFSLSTSGHSSFQFYPDYAPELIPQGKSGRPKLQPPTSITGSGN